MPTYAVDCDYQNSSRDNPVYNMYSWMLIQTTFPGNTTINAIRLRFNNHNLTTTQVRAGIFLSSNVPFPNDPDPWANAIAYGDYTLIPYLSSSFLVILPNISWAAGQTAYILVRYTNPSGYVRPFNNEGGTPCTGNSWWWDNALGPWAWTNPSPMWQWNYGIGTLSCSEWDGYGQSQCASHGCYWWSDGHCHDTPQGQGQTLGGIQCINCMFAHGPFQGGTNHLIMQLIIQNIGDAWGTVHAKLCQYPGAGQESLINQWDTALNPGENFEIDDSETVPDGITLWPLGVKVWGSSEYEPAWGTNPC